MPRPQSQAFAKHRPAPHLDLPEIEGVLCDAFAAASSEHRGKGSEDSLAVLRQCAMRLWLYCRIALDLNDTSLCRMLAPQEPHSLKERLSYCTRVLTSMMLSHCGVEGIFGESRDGLDAGDSLGGAPGALPANPLDLNELARLTARQSLPDQAIRTLFLLIGNLLYASVDRDRTLRRQLLEFWARSDEDLDPLYRLALTQPCEASIEERALRAWETLQQERGKTC